MPHDKASPVSHLQEFLQHACNIIRPWHAMALVFCLTLSFACHATQVYDLADVPLGLPSIPAEAARDSNRRMIQLGKRLFFDSRLSADGTVSCGKCHIPSHSFADARARSLGYRNQIGTRNAPSLLNVVYQKSLFWDGRAADLESQVSAPLTNPVEHALSSASDVLNVIRSDTTYVDAFSRAFKVDPAHIDADHVAHALSTYERSLLSGGSAFDHYQYGHDSHAMGEEAIRGLALFRERARCATCHTIDASSALLTDGEFHMSPIRLPADVNSHLGPLTKKVLVAKESGFPRELERLIATDSDIAALGRFIVTLSPSDIGKFKTPSLRNVALTAPYMHDGSVKTLEEAVELELYGRGQALNYPIALTANEKRDLVSFLRALTSARGPTPEPRAHVSDEHTLKSPHK
jgi:cytochrome c peroxidase